MKENKLKIVIGLLLFYLIMPVVVGCIIVKLFLNGEGLILSIIFFSLIVLELILSINKLNKFMKEKKKNKGE